MATLTSMDQYFNYELKIVHVDGLMKVCESLPLSGHLRDILMSMLIEEE